MTSEPCLHSHWADGEITVCTKKCPPRNIQCLVNNTQTISFQRVTIPSVTKLERPLVVARLQTVTVGSGWSYRVTSEVLTGNEAGFFAAVNERNAGALQLIKPVRGPRQFSIQMQVNVITHHVRTQTTRHVTFIEVHVSANES